MAVAGVCAFILWLGFHSSFVQAADVTVPLRSGPLQWHLHWESILSLAETMLRERTEEALLGEFAQLRQRIFEGSPQELTVEVWLELAVEAWSTISPSALLLELQNADWPNYLALMEMAVTGSDWWTVMRSLRDQLRRLQEDWEQMQNAVSIWNSEAKRSAAHLPVNFEIILKQASVLQGMLSAAPGFSRCLQKALEDARRTRPTLERYRSAMVYIQTGRLEGDHLKPRSSTFAGEEVGDLALEEMLETTKATAQQLLESLGSDIPEAVDWCSGVRELWVSENDPCTELAKDVARLRSEVVHWEAPFGFLTRNSRWQFSVAPNITRLEILTGILEEVQGCTVGSISHHNFSSELQGVAADDRASLQEEYHILHRTAQALQGFSVGDPRLLGMIRGVLEAQHVIHMFLDEASTWAFRIKTRGNGLQFRLQEVAQRLASLHTTLKSSPNYRSWAFNEIHEAGHWGRASSGKGSSQRATATLGATFLHFLQGIQLTSQLSILDVGCGWGEWLPSMLSQAMMDGQLDENLRYFGLDIAEKPIASLQNRYKHTALRFAVLDACRDLLPREFSVAVVRHVFQHLTLADAMALLRNVYQAKPQLLVLSSWPLAKNQDLQGGSSAFEALLPGFETFKGYNLRKWPFDFPEPLKIWKEMAGEELLLYPITVFESMYEPPSRNGYGMSLLAPSCPGGSCQWYNQGCEIGCPAISETQAGCAHPAQPRLIWGQDDQFLQYKQDGYGGDTEHHPWRYPGSAPVKAACGLTAGGTAPLGQLDPPPGFTTGVAGKQLPQLLEETVWVAGSEVEVAWGIAANHGGGYQYRLCPANEDPTEECFQKMPLEFVGEDHWLQFGNGYDVANRIAVKARRVSGEKVVPSGSTWTMNPIPGCKDTGGRARSACSEPTFTPAPGDDKVWRYADGTTKGIFGYGGGHCFGNLTKNPDAKCSLEEYRNASFDFGVVDKVKVPDVPEGQYVLSWRWDCEMTKQIWTNCADVTIKKGGQSTLPFSPIPGCSVCCGDYGLCANCSQCLESKEGACAYCWKPLPWWEGRNYWTPRAKAIQCLGYEGTDGGPGEYMPGDSLEEPWSPGCKKCWSYDSCAKYPRPLQAMAQASRINWMLVTGVVLAVGAAMAGLALLLRKKAVHDEAAREASFSATASPVSTEMT